MRRMALPLGGLPLGRVSDEALLSGLTTGDPEIAVAFVRRFQRTVFGVAVAVVRDPQLAEDIAQQTFERAWRHAQVYDPRRGSVRTWLTAVAHNLAVDAVRARRASPVPPEDLDALLGLVTETPERWALADESARRVRRAVAALPRGQARALVMAGIYGMTAREVAGVEGIPLGTAKTRIRTGMLRVRALLEEGGPEEGNLGEKDHGESKIGQREPGERKPGERPEEGEPEEGEEEKP
ncbi:RNA polymerase sigma factor [Streptomyces sp. NPDC101115]|uniref:RNA polymerase sigma factor n=1 Tax=Streptomyces sp. NPDC101115 TaxID=3366106 RepID=UPI00380BBEC3